MRQKTQNQFLKFSIHLSVRKSREKNYSQIYGTYKASLWRNLSTGKPPKISLAQSFVLQLQFTSHNLFRTVVLRKLFDIRFSYKHCNFSHVCLLVNMASKTVTRSIRPRVYDNDGLDTFFFFKTAAIGCSKNRCRGKLISQPQSIFVGPRASRKLLGFSGTLKKFYSVTQ